MLATGAMAGQNAPPTDLPGKPVRNAEFAPRP
jgi:hypothetical protein